MVKVTAAIITLNEEKNLERCLKALKQCVDEIVVLDSFSTDKTAEICAAYKVTFIQKNWLGYAQSKNELNKSINSSYILSIDADEVPDQELIDDLNRIKAEGLDGIYQVNRKTNYCGKWIYHCGWYPEFKLRLFPKKGVKWEGDFVHETLSFPKSLTVNKLNGHLEHFSYHNESEHRIKAFQYADLSVQKYLKEKKKTYFLQPVLSALAKFLSIYVFKRGFLDGRSGWVIAKISASANHYKYRKLKDLNKRH
ncbi:MAG: glycosyltransferase family 2 protein [Crocinitomicaceae bacterium]|nr:glycosyltransferase family 2 protein [Crocinitomicaceae bacterium]